MKAIDYFQGIFSHIVDTNIIESAINNRDLYPEELIINIDEMIRDLILADILFELSRKRFVSSLGKKGFSITMDGNCASFISDDAILKEAIAIYKAYGL